MKRMLASTIAALVVASLQPAFAEDTNTVDLAAAVKSATARFEEELRAGKTKTADMVDNLRAINALIVKNQKHEDREHLARLYLLIARIHEEALKNETRAAAVLSQVKRDFAGTQAAGDATKREATLKAKLAADDAATPEGLEVGTRFPQFSETDVAGRPLSLSNYRGRIVLIDFWATWCGPCVEEMPNVIAAFRKYQPAGFEIIGISLDSSKDKLVSFTTRSRMTWPQYFDGQGWDNKLAKQFNVRSIPATYLLDKRGKIIGKNLRGTKLAEAVARALAE